jgi:hypothetical protein
MPALTIAKEIINNNMPESQLFLVFAFLIFVFLSIFLSARQQLS